MTISINTNSTATLATDNLASANRSLQRSLQRLSSGSKIVNPSDDAGGLAVSMKMQAALNRQKATANNLANSISYLQTQDGALETAGKILDRIGELKVLHGDATKNATDKSNYDTEFLALTAQLNDLKAESFNGVSLFSTTSRSVYTTGEMQTASQMEVGGIDLFGSGQTETSLQAATFTDAFTGPLDPSKWHTFGTVTASGGIASLDDTSVLQPYPTFYEGPVSVSFDVRMSSGGDNFTVTAISTNGVDVFDSVGQGLDDGSWHSLTLDIAADGAVSQSLDGSPSAPNGTGPFTENPTNFSIVSDFLNGGNVEVRNYVFTGFESVTSGSESDVSTVANAAGLGTLDISTVKDALEEVATYRAENGAQQSRLQFASEMLTTNQINIEAANSRIADVDVAAESTALARYNVLVQAGASMLSQANSSQQVALKLIG